MKLLAALAAPSPGATASAGSALERPKEPTVPAATVSFFMLNCMTCHGPDGRGMSAARAAMPPLPDFTGKEWQLAHSNPQLEVSILEGKGTFMPPWRGKMSPDLAQSLVAYVRGFGPPGLLASGSAPASEFSKSFDKLRSKWDALEAETKALLR
jgi:mono/diheme cytochrome c family protein